MRHLVSAVGFQLVLKGPPWAEERLKFSGGPHDNLKLSGKNGKNHHYHSVRMSLFGEENAKRTKHELCLAPKLNEEETSLL